MGFGVKVSRRHGERVRRHLLSHNVFALRVKIVQDDDFITFPVTDLVSESDIAGVSDTGAEIVEFEHVQQKELPVRSIEEYLKDSLSPGELDSLVKAFDVVGDIAVIEVPEELVVREKLIAEAIMNVHSNIRVVCKKVGAHSGTFRVQGVKVIGGENRTETTYMESGVKMKVDVSTSYFSPRLSQERLRIASQVKPGETVACLFGGVAPYALVIAKTQPLVGMVYSVELNPAAHEYALENIALNKFQGKIEAVLGDAGEACRNALNGKCDRVIMPLPKGGEEFLDAAISALKPSSGVVHFYQFAPKSDLFSQPAKKLEEAAKKLGRKVEVLSTQKVGMQSPRVYRVCVDALVS